MPDKPHGSMNWPLIIIIIWKLYNDNVKCQLEKTEKSKRKKQREKITIMLSYVMKKL